MRRVLAIDDDEGILSLLYKFLKAEGYDVVIADNGDDGIELFRNGYHFDIVITDIGMPGIDGNEVAKRIRSSKTPKTPIIAITGSQQLDIQKGLFDYVLVKPFKLKTLKDTIGSFV
ncbi:MAG: response regulator [Desulfobacteraceae bacterium]|jgi:CheY-like chemotaxis protein